jgi:hypothetical protein
VDVCEMLSWTESMHSWSDSLVQEIEAKGLQE